MGTSKYCEEILCSCPHQRLVIPLSCTEPDPHETESGHRGITQRLPPHSVLKHGYGFHRASEGRISPSVCHCAPLSMNCSADRPCLQIPRTEQSTGFHHIFVPSPNQGKVRGARCQISDAEHRSRCIPKELLGVGPFQTSWRGRLLADQFPTRVRSSTCSSSRTSRPYCR